MNVNDFLDIAIDITEGMQDLNWTMRNVTHDEIATAYVKMRLKEAKQAPDMDD